MPISLDISPLRIASWPIIAKLDEQLDQRFSRNLPYELCKKIFRNEVLEIGAIYHFLSNSLPYSTYCTHFRYDWQDMPAADKIKRGGGAAFGGLNSAELRKSATVPRTPITTR